MMIMDDIMVNLNLPWLVKDDKIQIGSNPLPNPSYLNVWHAKQCFHFSNRKVLAFCLLVCGNDSKIQLEKVN